MNLNKSVNNQRKDYKKSQKLVSTTNTKGVITDVNQDFIEISGFNRNELIGETHNFVRHPWMPQVAFAELLEYCKNRKSWWK